MSNTPKASDDDYVPPPGTIGAGHSVSGEPPARDTVTRLREVVAEVTSGRIPVPERRGPRF